MYLKPHYVSFFGMILYNILCYHRGFSSNRIPKIAIIGGGIGGTASSYFLHELFGKNGAHIDLYEYNKIGGRLATIEVDNREYEVGGSIIHQRNKYMLEFLKILGLKKRKTASSRFGLYDGKQFIFTESQWEIINLVKLTWRYGFGPVKLQSFIDNMLTKFERIYELQADSHTFRTVPDLLAAMSPQFVEALGTTSAEGFRKRSFSERMVDELVMATLTANYGQDTSVQQFVGMVSVAGASGGLWAVHGGNKLVAERLLQAGGATLHQSQVLSITLTNTSEFEVRAKPASDGPFTRITYDVVILAMPLTNDTTSKVQFYGFPAPFEFPGNYHRTVCTIVRGDVDHANFGFAEKSDMVDEILTTRMNLRFNSLGRINPVNFEGDVAGENISDVWKVFSQVPLNEEDFGELFSDRQETKVVDWLAYPQYGSAQRSDGFELHDNLYHLNSIEWAASAMEMSAISAKNIALLVYNNFHNVTSELKMGGVPHEEL